MSRLHELTGSTICAFGEASAWPTQSLICKFRDELKTNFKAGLAVWL